MIFDGIESSSSGVSIPNRGDFLFVLRLVFLRYSLIALLVSFSKMMVLLGRGAFSMFLAMSVQENLHVLFIVLAEEDLLD